MYGSPQPELHKGARHEESSGNIHTRRAHELLRVQFPEVTRFAEFRRAVDNRVKAMPLTPDFRKDGGNRPRVSNIKPRGTVPRSKLARRFMNLFCGGGEPQLVAGRGKIAGNFKPDPAASPADKNAARLLRIRRG